MFTSRTPALPTPRSDTASGRRPTVAFPRSLTSLMQSYLTEQLLPKHHRPPKSPCLRFGIAKDSHDSLRKSGQARVTSRID